MQSTIPQCTEWGSQYDRPNVLYLYQVESHRDSADKCCDGLPHPRPVSTERRDAPSGVDAREPPNNLQMQTWAGEVFNFPVQLDAVGKWEGATGNKSIENARDKGVLVNSECFSLSHRRLL